MARIGIFSGTFDPVHDGHTGFSLAALEQAGLEQVMLLPEARPRAKMQVTPLEHRVAMLERATAIYAPQLGVLQLSDERFSVARTLPLLQARFAGHELSLLMGSDVVRALERWEGVEQLLAAVELIVAMRGQDSYQATKAMLERLARQYPAVRLRYRLVRGPLADVASSHVRAQRTPTHGLALPVAAYIAAHRLYL